MVICLSGWKGSGKDECAKYLIEKYDAIRVALADPLKNSVAEEYGIDRSSLDDPKRKELPLLNMPVDPKDNYSKMISEFLFKEFRNKYGVRPSSFFWSDSGFTGMFEDTGPDGKKTNGMKFFDTLYWTPRALAILKGSTNRAVASNFWTNQAFGIMEAELKENPNQMIVVTDVRYQSELAQFKERFGDKVLFMRINRFKESPSDDPSERDLDSYKFKYYIDNTGTIAQMHEQVDKMLLSGL